MYINIYIINYKKNRSLIGRQRGPTYKRINIT